MNRAKRAVHEVPIYMRGERNEIDVEIALQWNDSYDENLFTFANNINTHEGGTHLSGFKAALTRTVNAYIASANIPKDLKDTPITGDDAREGLAGVISVKIPSPQFEGQTKTKLGNSEVKGIVEAIVNERLGAFFEENPAVAKSIIEKAADAARAREAARKARDLVAAQGRARRQFAARQAGGLLRNGIRRRASSTSSRATRPVDRPSRDATAGSRPSCRSRARSSTSRRPASTRCSAATRSGP